jgi:hypothetical protein
MPPLQKTTLSDPRRAARRGGDGGRLLRGDDRAAAGARSTAPIALLRRKLGEVAWQTVAERIHADLVSRFGSGPVKLEALAYLGVGTSPGA